MVLEVLLEFSGADFKARADGCGSCLAGWKCDGHEWRCVLTVETYITVLTVGNVGAVSKAAHGPGFVFLSVGSSPATGRRNAGAGPAARGLAPCDETKGPKGEIQSKTGFLL